MAFGEHRNKPTIVPLSTTKNTAAPHGAAQYVPNPKMARLLDGFQEFLTKKGYRLTASQLTFANTFFTGANVLLSGEAGTGKSYLIKALFEYLSLHGIAIARCASTGVAAFNIGGQTLHSFMGIGLGQEDVHVLVNKVVKNGKVRARIKAMEVLFIDEVSMCKGELLDKIDQIVRIVRGRAEPFGGAQLVLSGDFLQLPPVFKGEESAELAFQCASWLAAGIRTVMLREQMRQQGDGLLARVLGDLRVGNTDTLHLLDNRVNAVLPNDGTEAVRIFCKNVDVDEYNRSRLAALTTESKTYKARDTGLPYHTDSFNKNCPAPEVLTLKIGAQVMLLVNADVESGYVNGSVGVVKAFGPDYVRVQFKSGSLLVERNEWDIKEQEASIDGKLKLKVIATRSQVPLKLCYAVTAHKVQGQTIERAVVDVSEAFAEGQIYVALSRVRNLESLSIAGSIPHRAIRANPDCVRFYQELDNQEKPNEDLAF